jgi:5'-3' exonuclease
MKILIKENRIQNLINNILNDELTDLYEYRGYTTDSTGEWLTIRYMKDGKNVMIYRDDRDLLYVATEELSKLNIFDLDYNTLQTVVGKWFELTYELPVDKVMIISSKALN